MKKLVLLVVLAYVLCGVSYSQNTRSMTEITETYDLFVSCSVDSVFKKHISLINTDDTYSFIPVSKKASLILIDYPAGVNGAKTMRKRVFPVGLEKEKGEFNFPIYYKVTGNLKKLIPELNDESLILLSWKADLKINHQLEKNEAGDTLNYFASFDGSPTGKEVSYNPESGIKEINNSLLGYYHGKNEKWKNGIKMYEAHYYNGNKQGVELTYYETGTLKTKKNFVNNKEEGEAFSYFPSGKVREKLFYKSGMLDGYGERFLENGNLEASMYTYNNVPHGQAKKYYPSGKLKAVLHFHLGKKNGGFTTYYENGAKESEGEYEMDAKVGEWKRWDKDGNLVKE